MKDFKVNIWQVVLLEAEKLCKEDKNLVVYRDSEQVFYKNFDYYKNLIIDNFMKPSNEPLDRHKIAAITICSILRATLVGISASVADQHDGYKDENAFLANEKLALSTAFSHMFAQLQYEFEKGKIPYEEMIPSYVLPTPLSCGRKFDEVLCRDLYYAKKHFKLNPLTIANLLFFIEVYSFEVHRINLK